MGIIAVLVAAAAGFAFGSIWYMALARAWRGAVGMPEAERVANMKRPTPYVIAFVGMIVAAGMLRHVFAMSGLTGAGAGLVGGLGAGAFVAAPFLFTCYAFGMRPMRLAAIDAGYAIGGCGAIGLVLGLFG